MEKRGEGPLCSCGSGRMFKDCCGAPSKVIDLTRARWHKLTRELRHRMGEFADQNIFAEEAERAQDLYFSCLNPDLVDWDDEFTLERCFEWFIFDYQVSDGLTILEHFERTQKLVPGEEELLGCWKNARLSLYEVVKVYHGEGVLIKDLVSPNIYRVHDVNMTAGIDEGSILFIRVLAVGPDFEFSTGGLALPGSCREILQNRFNRDFKNYLRRRKNGTINDYLASHAHIINGWVVELGVAREHSLLPDGPGHDRIPSNLAQKLTDAFLDDYYERWIDQIVPVLGGTPRHMCKTASGRQKVEELLKELDLMEKDRKRRGQPHYDINKVRSKLGLNVTAAGSEKENSINAWEREDYAGVARYITSGMQELRFDKKQAEAALHLWHDFCAKEHPVVRKPQAWSAAVVYAIARMEVDYKLKQKELAGYYGVPASSVSLSFHALCRSLGLFVFDSRYSTKRPPSSIQGLREPLLKFVTRKKNYFNF